MTGPVDVALEQMRRDHEQRMVSIARAIGYTRGLDRAMGIMSQYGLVGTPAWFAVLQAIGAADEAEAAKPVCSVPKLTVIDGGAA